MGLVDDMLRTAMQRMQRGEYGAAAEVCRQALRSRPGEPRAMLMLASACLESRNPAEALAVLTELASVAPHAAEVHYNLGVALMDLGRPADAEAKYKRAIELAPRLAAARYNLADCLFRLSRLDEAAASLEEALRLEPTLARAHYNLANAYRDQGRMIEALASFERALALEPSSRAAATNRLVAMNYPLLPPELVTEAHRAWGERLERDAGEPAPHGGTPDPDRPLRVGFLSPDFRKHSCAYFLEPLLSHLGDASRDEGGFELYCYANWRSEDEVTQRFRALVPNWRSVGTLIDARAEALIRADAIDVLIECAGLTDGNRVDLLARQPAPLQITYLGYPNTTGLTRVHRRMVDAVTDPPGTEHLMVETPLRLDGCLWCYRPDADAPDVAPAPCAASGTITFGSFNNLSKISDQTVELWCAVLRAVPGSRLLVKNRWMADPGTRSRLLSRFTARGIERERLECVPGSPTTLEHLVQYARIDVQLDTYPYHGTTTTCESLWQGVPVLSLTGDRHASRVGTSLLTCVGLGDWACDSPERFVSRAAEVSRDPRRLDTLRAALRGRVSASALRDERGYARRFAGAVRAAWRDRCRERV